MGQEQFSRRNYLAALKEMGVWKDIPFKASNFTAAVNGTWTVTAGNVIVNRYTRIGNSITWNLWVGTTIIGGTPPNTLFIVPPIPDKIAKYSNSMGACLLDSGALVLNVRFNPGQTGFPATVGLSTVPVTTFPAGNLGVYFTATYEHADNYPRIESLV